MCYDIRYLTKRIKKYAEHVGDDPEEVARLEKQLAVFTDEVGPVYHTTAFDHWQLPVLTSSRPREFQFFQWGLIPPFVQNTHEYQTKYASRYLNSRIENLFDEKVYNPKLNRELDNPFYRSAINRRCMVMLDGYYDWHWQGKQSYNFHILLRSEAPMWIAEIWRTWQSKEEDIRVDTVSLVTTDANALCRKVHNRPKASEGPRQLAILDDAAAEAWLEPEASPEQLRKNVRVFPASALKVYPVKKLFIQEGRKRIPLNDPSCIQEANFPELQLDAPAQGSLF